MDILNPDKFFEAFPHLDRTIKPHSPHTSTYNCIAFALGFEDKSWWPVEEQNTDAYWPRDSCPRTDTISTFIATFAKLGFEPCTHEHSEDGYEKIALFTDETGEPTHAARLCSNETWASKCGGNVDIEHKLRELEGPAYGKVTMFFRRHRKTP